MDCEKREKKCESESQRAPRPRRRRRHRRSTRRPGTAPTPPPGPQPPASQGLEAAGRSVVPHAPRRWQGLADGVRTGDARPRELSKLLGVRSLLREPVWMSCLPDSRGEKPLQGLGECGRNRTCNSLIQVRCSSFELRVTGRAGLEPASPALAGALPLSERLGRPRRGFDAGQGTPESDLLAKGIRTPPARQGRKMSPETTSEESSVGSRPQEAVGPWAILDDARLARDP